jgi:hypothetical protein
MRSFTFSPQGDSRSRHVGLSSSCEGAPIHNEKGGPDAWSVREDPRIRKLLVLQQSFPPAPPVSRCFEATETDKWKVLRSHECPVACWEIPYPTWGDRANCERTIPFKLEKSLKNAIECRPRVPPSCDVSAIRYRTSPYRPRRPRPPEMRKRWPLFPSLCRAASGAQRILKANGGGIYGCNSTLFIDRPSCVTCYMATSRPIAFFLTSHSGTP